MASLEDQAHLQAIIASSDDAIYSKDLDGKILSWNAGAEQLYGYSAEEAIGLFISILVPEGQPNELTEILKQLQSGGRVERYETTRRRKNGSLVEVTLTVSPIHGKGGEVVGASAIARDITERKRMEASLRLTRTSVDRANDLLFWVRPDGTISDVNETTVQRLGFTRSALLEMNVTGDTAVAVTGYSEVWEVVRGSGSFMMESFLHTKDGNTIPVEMTFSYVNHDGAEYSCIFARDISDRKELERELLQVQKMEAIARLASSITHDFGNLLMGISGCTDLALKRIEEDDPARVYLEETKKAAKRGSGLIRQLLAFSRRKDATIQDVDVDQVIERTERMLQSLMGERVELRISKGAPGWRTRGDVGQMEQVLLNLAVNARDAMPNGGQLTIDTAQVELTHEQTRKRHRLEQGDFIRLTVTDTGIGMDDQTKERLFEPFFTTKNAGQGTGLGLATVFGIVTRMGGDVVVRSTLGSGSTFVVFLPRVDESTGQSRIVGVETPGRRGSETILIVEDDDLVRLSLRDQVASWGYHVFEVGDAEQALLVAQRHHPIDIVITDVVLPDIAGHQLVGEIIQSNPKASVIYMSAYPAGTLVDEGLLPAGTKALEKPFSEGDLMDEIRCVLDGKCK